MPQPIIVCEKNGKNGNSCSYLSIAADSIAELEIRKSRFLGMATSTTTQEDRSRFLDQVRKDHAAASHTCFGCVLGPPNIGNFSSSDDGEPQGTAGKPILNVVQHSGLGDLLVVVVRYYGGIKLGKGGLARAYSSAASAAITDIETKTITPMLKAILSCDYALEDRMRRVLDKFEAADVEASYDTSLTLKFSVAQANFHQLNDSITEISSGNCQLKESG